MRLGEVIYLVVLGFCTLTVIQAQLDERCPPRLPKEGKTNVDTFILREESWAGAGRDLQFVVDCLAPGDILLLDLDGPLVPTNTTLITKPITIAAFFPSFRKNLELKRKAVLTCPGDAGLLIIRSGDVTLSNLHIKNCWQATTRTKSFSPIYFQSCGGQVELVHSKFEDNNYGLAGNFGRTTGAIRATGVGCSVNVWNVEFKNLTGNVGGVVLDAVEANFTDVKFVDNTGRLYGAIAMQNNATLNISNAGFIGNVGVTGSAAISSIDSNLFMKSIQAVNNSGDSATFFCQGKVQFSIINANFDGNFGDSFAVGIFLAPPRELSRSGVGGAPGSLPIGVDAVVTNVTFRDTINGTAFRAIQANIIMQNVVFEGNVASPDRGGILQVLDSIIDIRNASFVKNVALGDGALAAGRTILKMVDAVFLENVGEKGAGVSAIFSEVTARNLDFHRNVARTQGGGMHVQGTLDLKNATFVDNVSETSKGGGLDVSVNSGVARLVDVLFIRNSAGTSGGGVSATKGITNVDPNDFFASIFSSFGEQLDAEDNWFVDGVLFDSNVAREHGGGLRCTDCVGTIMNTKFVNNTSVELGGGGLSLGTLQVPIDMMVNNCIFRDNRCAREGGGLSLTGRGSVVSIVGGEFARNFALLGGAVGARSTSSIATDGVIFVENEAENGGAIYQKAITGDFDLTTSRTKFIRNQSVKGGAIQLDAAQDTGAFGNVLGRIAITNSSQFVANRALESGGAIWVEILGQMNISDVLFDQNEADLGGGAMTIVFPPTKTSNPVGNTNISAITDALNTNNSDFAALLGGIFGLGTTQTEDKSLIIFITNATFRNNSSPNGLGGGIQTLSIPGEVRRFSVSSVLDPDQTVVEFRNVTFDGNAASKGGGLYGNLTILDMQDVTFKGNSARESGGGMSLFLSLLKGERCNFVGNAAEQVGGGIYVTPSDRMDINAEFNCTNCVMEGNTARFGGAVHDITGFPVLNFVAPRFENNFVTNGGGGALYHKAGGVVITCPRTSGEIILESQASFSANPCLRKIFKRNKAREIAGGGGAYGDDVATKQVRLATSSDRLFGQESGAMLETFTVRAFDSYDQQIKGGLEQDAFLVSIFTPNSTSAVVSGQTISSFEKGAALFRGLSVSSPVSNASVPVSLILAFESEDVPRGMVEVELLACRPGQVIDDRQCRDCAPGTFSIDPTQEDCNPCSPGGTCEEGVMIPADGWWTAGATSNRNFECISSRACAFEGREALLLSHAVNGTPAEFPICRKGYQGPLCNSCQKGYGHTLQNFCRKCKSQGAEIGLIFLACIIAMAGMVIYVALHPITSHQQAGGSPSFDELSTIWKVFISHLQVLALARFSQVQWPNSLHYLLVAAGMVGTLGLGDEVLLDCAISDDTQDKAIASVYVAFALPALFLGALFVVYFPWYYFKSKRLKDSGIRCWGLLIFTAAAVCFHVYPFFAMEVLSVFNCTEIDGSGNYWLSDMSVECFPMGMTIVVGCFGSLILLSVIIALLAVRKDITDTFAGGLICSYKTEKYFWEAVMFSVKLAIACIMTFGAKMGVQVQMNLSMGVISLGLLAQILGKPFKHDSMNYLQVVSYLANALTFFQGIFVFDQETTTNNERNFMVGAIIVIHSAAGLCFLGVLATYFRGPNSLMPGQAWMAERWVSAFMSGDMISNGSSASRQSSQPNGLERGGAQGEPHGEGGNFALNPISESPGDVDRNVVGGSNDARRSEIASEV